MNTLINTIVHVVVCIAIPAIVTCIGGPFVGVFAEGLAKLVWAGPTIWNLLERQINLWRSSDWDKYTTLQKWFSNLMFGIMLLVFGVLMIAAINFPTNYVNNKSKYCISFVDADSTLTDTITYKIDSIADIKNGRD